MERGRAERCARRGPAHPEGHLHVSCHCILTAIFPGCKIPASASTGGKPLRGSPVRESVQCGLEVTGG